MLGCNPWNDFGPLHDPGDAQILVCARESFLALQPTQTSSKAGFSCFTRNEKDQVWLSGHTIAIQQQSTHNQQQTTNNDATTMSKKQMRWRYVWCWIGITLGNKLLLFLCEPLAGWRVEVDQQDPVNLLIHIYGYIQFAPLRSYHLEGKNLPTCKTVKYLLKLDLLKVVLLKHYIGLATVLLKHILLKHVLLKHVLLKHFCWNFNGWAGAWTISILEFKELLFCI